MREVGQVQPSPQTELEILRHGLGEIATEACGSHDEGVNPCYRVRREFKEYAQRVLAVAAHAE